MADTYKIAEHVAWRRVGDDVVILDLETSVYYTLNDTGTTIWERLAQGAPLDRVIETVATDYEEGVARVTKDANALLKTLRAKKLLVPA